MGAYTAFIGFCAFLTLELAQGIVLTNFLRIETRDINQWAWLIADGVLLLFWVLQLLRRNTELLTKDMPFIPVPSIAVAWLLYLLLVFAPRLSWTMDVAGTCLGYTAQGLNITTDEEKFSFGLISQFSWNSNTLITVLAVFSTSMLVCLVVAGYSQHGMVASKRPLDIDMAEAAFCLIDGIEFLQVFFEVSSDKVCELRSMGQDTSPVFNAVSNSTEDTALLSYIQALEGRFGHVIIALTCVCFSLPFFALWQLKHRSAEIKVGEAMDKDAAKLKAIEEGPQPSIVVSNIELDEPENGAPGEASTNGDNTDSTPHTISAYQLDYTAHQGNKRTREYLEKELYIIKFAYIIWDLLVINTAGAAVRFILWFKYDRPISALITKNILSIIFRLLNLFLEYIRPLCYGKTGDKSKFNTTSQRSKAVGRSVPGSTALKAPPLKQTSVDRV
eukprot:scpid47811/ scgid28408/ 